MFTINSRGDASLIDGGRIGHLADYFWFPVLLDISNGRSAGATSIATKAKIRTICQLLIINII